MKDERKHYFQAEDAIAHGILEAILLENIRFWIGKNKANSKNFCDGRTWTYNSVSEYHDQFPYATPKQLRRALDKLVKKGVLLKGCHAQNPWDRRTWYSLVDEERVPGITELQERCVRKPTRKSSRRANSLGLLPRPPAALV